MQTFSKIIFQPPKKPPKHYVSSLKKTLYQTSKQTYFKPQNNPNSAPQHTLFKTPQKTFILTLKNPILNTRKT
jgi:hypothetical protein